MSTYKYKNNKHGSLYVPGENPFIPPMPPVKPPKKEKIKRLYEDNDFVIDLFVEDNTLRVSIFEDGHFKDEIFINKENYIR